MQRLLKYYKFKTLAAALAAASALGCSQPSRGGDGEDPSFSVKKIKGVPFICENGEPQRGRMFYGATGGVKYKVVDPEWTTVSMEFTCECDGTVGMRISYDALVKDMSIKKISLVNTADNSSFAVVDPAKPDTLKRVAVSDKKRGKVSLSNGVVLFEKDTATDSASVRFLIGEIGAQLKKGVKYRIDVELKCGKRGWVDMVAFDKSGIVAGSSTPTFSKQLKLAALNGVDFVTIGMHVPWDWDGPGKVERVKKVWDKIFDTMVKINPNVKVIPRLGVDAPAWWLDKHPDSEMRNYDGKPTTRMSRGNFTSLQRFAAVSSLEYRAAAQANLRRTIEFIESNYGKHIAGYHPCGANTGEWFYGQSQGPIPSGYDKSTLAAWRKWLSKKYGDAATLEKAWNKKGVSPETAEVPTYDERMKAVSNIVDPAKLQNVVDFNLFLNDEMADTVIGFGKVVKEATLGKKLSLTFYGYGYELASGVQSPAVTGHYAARKLLESPYIDIMTGPVSYGSRGKGGVKNYMSAVESVLLAGKIWCDEDDNRTYLIWNSGSILLVADPNQKTQKDSVDVMRRNLAQQIIRNTPSWWMDLFGTGWYEDPVLWKQIALCDKVERDMIKRPHFFKPPVALIYDEASMSYIGKASYLTTGPLMYASRREMHFTGIPYGQYMLEDILGARANPKLNIFLNTVALSKAQRQKMREAAERSASIYMWATGFADTTAQKLSLEAIEEATGFKVKRVKPAVPIATTTPEGLKMGLSERIGNFAKKIPIDDLFSPIPQEGDIVLAKYDDGNPAIVLRKSGDHPQLFCGVTYLPPCLVRMMAKETGIHIYTEQPASVFANGAYVSICASTTESHTVDFKTTKEIYDVFTGKCLGKGPILNVDLAAGEVLFARIGKRNPKK